jgi:hypothetical protein
MTYSMKYDPIDGNEVSDHLLEDSSDILEHQYPKKPRRCFCSRSSAAILVIVLCLSNVLTAGIVHSVSTSDRNLLRKTSAFSQLPVRFLVLR